ncbi:membrane primary amine oxidase-like [Protopterus annectens]|uniref:membrane primary amine oxidase-like n=1 Tax=Protopterus annectens TaxID=7888 RepID=UPI001CF96C0D|nr:membrane primary amine oxidase-like [Protopterus annectens]
MNPKILSVLLLLALVTIVVLICILMSGKTSKNAPWTAESPSTVYPKHDEKSKIFSDLSSSELQTVENYLKRQIGMNLVNVFFANPSDNYIYLIELELPKKREALEYLDMEGPKPVREARAVVVFGAVHPPNVTEYVVGPLPNPAYHMDVTRNKYNPIHFNARPVLVNEYQQIASTINDEFAKAPRTMNDTFGADWRKLARMTAGPRGFRSGDRISWFVIFQNVSGFFLHPVGLEVLVDHSSLNLSEWSVKKVFYCGQYFNGMREVEAHHINGTLPLNKFKQVHFEYENYASLKPKKKHTSLAPVQFPLHGLRYSVQDNHVMYYRWSFSFGVSLVSGMRLFDIRYDWVRIAYELSVQEAIAVYGSNTPASTMNRYIDGSHGLGRFAHQLVRGVDCPYLATYVDTEACIDPFSFQKTRDSICIFEYNAEIPLRRHFSDLNYFNYGGLTNSVLVIRTTSTVANYDYIWDVIFYQNGAIKFQAHPTGYISTAYFYGDNAKYGHRVGETSLGVIHTHSMHFKADLDIAGRPVNTAYS